MLPSVDKIEEYIRQAAIARGIDPEVALAVARSEGLGEGIWQSNMQQPYGREQSFGPFQLHVAPKGRSPGLGNAFKEKTGLDPSNPDTWTQGVDFALDTAKQDGWGAWMGAKKIGVTGKAGIGGAKASTPPPSTAREDRGEAYNNGYGTAAPGGLLDAPSDSMAAMGDIGLQLMKKAQKKPLTEEEQKWLQPRVMPALRRYTLEGLLG